MSPLTPAQERALEAIREERVRFYPSEATYATLGSLGSIKRVRADTAQMMLVRSFAEIVYRNSSREGVLVLTDAGREALEAASR